MKEKLKGSLPLTSKRTPLVIKGWIILLMISCSGLGLAQTPENAYTAEYDQQYRIMPHFSYSTVELRERGKGYLPNSPLAIGFGFAIKQTFLDFKFGYGVIPLRDSDYGKTKSIDLQFHNYNESFMFDLFFQNYKGFYNRTDGEIQLFEQMELLQGGFETALILNSDKFSVEAAFEQSEIQIISAGSAVVGAGAYGYRIRPGEAAPDSSETDYINNLQFGLNGGYAYSWVLDSHWSISAMATLGANFGNASEQLKDLNVKVYPTVFARFSTAYHTNKWALSVIMIAHNKSVYPDTYPNITLTTTKMELCYVYHFDHLFGKNN